MRDRRRRERHTPGLWRGSRATSAAPRPAVQHGTRGRSRFGWRILSLLIIISLSVVLSLFFSSNAFYVHSVSVGGLRYLTKEEVFTFAEIANMHVFWVDPEQVRQNVMREPTIADAAVFINWPPNMVQIVIEEREPAIEWVQAGIAVWIDLHGRIMKLREDRADLPRILVDDTIDSELGDNVLVPGAVVNGALQLAELLPTVNEFRYNPDYGLGYRDPGGWQIWFGTGTDMPEKILIYEAVKTNLQSRNIIPFAINVANPDAPFYCLENTACARLTR